MKSDNSVFADYVLEAIAIIQNNRSRLDVHIYVFISYFVQNDDCNYV